MNVDEHDCASARSALLVLEGKWLLEHNNEHEKGIVICTGETVSTTYMISKLYIIILFTLLPFIPCKK